MHTGPTELADVSAGLQVVQTIAFEVRRKGYRVSDLRLYPWAGGMPELAMGTTLGIPCPSVERAHLGPVYFLKAIGPVKTQSFTSLSCHFSLYVTLLVGQYHGSNRDCLGL